MVVQAENHQYHQGQAQSTQAQALLGVHLSPQIPSVQFQTNASLEKCPSTTSKARPEPQNPPSQVYFTRDPHSLPSLSMALHTVPTSESLDLGI